MVRRSWTRGMAMLLGLAAFPTLAVAQNQCVVPQSLPQSRAIFPPPGRTVNAPLTGYILALSWSPQFCKERGNEKKNAAQCGGPGKYGFVLHGLWPDGAGQNDPQWCKRVPPVSPEVMKQYFCATPSAGLLQYEWAKHGSCIESEAERYFSTASRLYAALEFPDMEALSRSQTDVGTFAAAFVATNPGLSADMVRVDVTQLGWLKEVRLCVGKDYRPVSCPRDIGGSAADTKLKIWPAR